MVRSSLLSMSICESRVAKVPTSRRVGRFVEFSESTRATLSGGDQKRYQGLAGLPRRATWKNARLVPLIRRTSTRAITFDASYPEIEL